MTRSKPQPALVPAPPPPKLSEVQAEIGPVDASVGFSMSPPPKAFALLSSVVPSGIFAATATFKLKLLVPAGAIAVVVVHVAVSLAFVVVDTTQDQADPLAPPGMSGVVNDRPAGKTSLTVVMPLVGADTKLPFLTAKLKTFEAPVTKVEFAVDFVKERSGGQGVSNEMSERSSALA